MGGGGGLGPRPSWHRPGRSLNEALIPLETVTHEVKTHLLPKLSIPASGAAQADCSRERPGAHSSPAPRGPMGPASWSLH